jgi:hypothetical protein
MKEIRITIRCLTEPLKHAKVIRVKAKLGRRKAQDLADLLDGTSLAYVHAPGANSPIGRCCICQGEVECAVSTVVDGAEAPLSCEEAMDDLARTEEKDRRRLEPQLARMVEGMKHGIDAH